ncbi:glycerol-3-phosphate acyltransferase [Falsibacillus pallidus]|uniref:Glycerol-3-phosphate acyltransferase n=1 Tax=Falsibacillus pallidus TaxID=493781 RepID=A0A370GMT0_9BACI|nr:glycerol-3-phosphate acyltransferase [Falsibacillus pallidus]RDI43213.1 glycerol-3-phosphate acyltransferase PlsY [Falsibacillus pallidus]
MNYIIGFILSYLFGSISGAYLVVKALTEKDVRLIGSSNAGATNAGRAAGKTGFLLTLLIDALKVWTALFIVVKMMGYNEILLLISCFGLMLGHLFPIYLRFKGGKGVVVYLVSALYLSPFSILVFAAVMIVCYGILRKYTISGFISMASIPLSTMIITGSWMITLNVLLLFFFVLVSNNKTNRLKSD